ncbi:MAG: fumarylacetoacetate hydrolase family protein [Candidatus Eiseniibacteriota bacterium]
MTSTPTSLPLIPDPVFPTREGVTHIVRVRLPDGPRFARVDGARLVPLSDAPWRGGVPHGDAFPLRGAAWLPPCEPTKIVCIGVNYADHAKESVSRTSLPDEPVLFMKPPSALLAHGEAIRLPAGVGRVDHEAELAIVIGRTVQRAGPEEARAAIAGVTCVNDVSARLLQKKDGQFTRAKGFDTFCPIGPGIAMGLDPADLAVIARVNGQERQHGRSRDLACGAVDLVCYVSNVMTLVPGDVISTGTPAGVGPIVPGDRVEVEVEGVGTLANSVIERM